MFLDALLIILLVFAFIRGKKQGLFRAITRLLSLFISAGASFAFHDKVNLFLRKTPLYETMLEKLTENAATVLESGDTTLLRPFLKSANMLPNEVAERMAGMLVSIITFILIYVLVKLLIQLLDRTIFHLPLLKPLNRLMGSIWSVLFMIIIMYLIIGILGTLSVFTTTPFLAEQMQQSVLVRGMYTNNLVLKFLFQKG